MTTRSNLHTHSVFCDGKNTIEEMVESAVSLGFESIGFSSHMYTGYEFDECGIKKDNVDAYFQELDRVREKCGDRIMVYKGLELESLVKGETRPVVDSRCDYTIGSSHFFRRNGKYFCVDYTPEMWRDAEKEYGGDTLALLSDYFEDLASFAEESNFDIIGHIDLPTKFNECSVGPLFVETKEYRDIVISAVDRIAEAGKIFEVNTGAISRGWRTEPYPAPFILKRLLEKKAPIIITSDSHQRDTLDCHFEETEALLKALGFKEQMRLTGQGFVPVSL